MLRNRILSAFTLTMLLSAGAMAQPASAPASGPTTGRGRGAATAPAPSATLPVLQRGTTTRHSGFLDVAKAGNIDLLFIGDSITDFWRRPGPRYGKAVWDKYFEPLHAANFGISADRTQHVLFRVQNGELEGFKAKCIVMMIGTNNLTSPIVQPPRNTPEETVEGYKLIVNEIRQRQPQAKLLLLAIFPRGNLATDPYRAVAKQVNAEIAKLQDGKNIFFLDINDKFLQPDGTLSPDIMPDYLHPNEKGYEIWASAIIDKVKELMAAK